MPLGIALAELTEHAGSQFDPRIIDALASVVSRSRGACAATASPTAEVALFNA